MRNVRMTATASVLPVAALLIGGCTGGMHRKGEQQGILHASYGHPIKGQAIWPDGEGRADNVGATLGHNYFFQDRWAFMTHVTPARVYHQSGGDSLTQELQLGFRYYFAEFGEPSGGAGAPTTASSSDAASQPGGAADSDPAARPPIGLFAEITGGLLYGDRSVPEDGSNTNFTQDTGLGIEVRLDDHLSWVTGYRLRHLSNGDMFGDNDNPSQNDHHVYTGLAITWD